MPARNSSSKTATLLLLGPKVHTTCTHQALMKQGYLHSVRPCKLPRWSNRFISLQLSWQGFKQHHTLVLQRLGIVCPDSRASRPSCTIASRCTRVDYVQQGFRVPIWTATDNRHLAEQAKQLNAKVSFDIWKAIMFPLSRIRQLLALLPSFVQSVKNKHRHTVLDLIRARRLPLL